MAVKEYIGARYVPKFDGVWDATKSYEPLTIVTDANNTTSYTSKKPVPVGTPLNNLEYWAITGTLSGAVVSLENRMVEAETDISGLESGLSTAQGNIAGLQSTVAGQGNRITANEKYINRQLYKKVVIIGDSYGIGGSQSGHSYTPYPTYLDSFLNISVYNCSESGAGFANIGDAGHSFEDLLDTLTPSVNKSEITDIFFLGGYNDRTYEGPQIETAISQAVARAKSLFVNADIHIGFIGWGIGSGDYPILARARQIYQKCGRYGANYLTNIEYVMHDFSYFDSDGIHPNNDGQIAIAVALCQYIYGSHVTVEKPRTNVTVVNSGSVHWTPEYITQKIDNNVLGWGWFEQVVISGMSNHGVKLWNGATWYSYAQMVNNMGFGRGYYGMKETIPCTAVRGGVSYAGLVSVRIVAGAVAINPVVFDGQGSFYNGMLDYIVIPPMWFTTSASDN